MDLALGIIAGLGTMGFGIFLTEAAFGAALRMAETSSWWGFPTWMAFCFCIGFPMGIGSIALGLIVFSRVSGVPL